MHDENELCPNISEQLKKHPEWFGEMVQTVAIANSTSPIVQRYGAAIKEHLVAYGGLDNQTGQNLTKSLKSVSQQKINPKYAYQNLKQHAGFSAEVQEVAQVNAERAIAGETGKVVRYDDVGMVNHPLYDLAELSDTGNIIEGTGVQMKFIGSNPSECWKKVLSPKCQKYVDSNTPIRVPSDYYNEMCRIADEQIRSLSKQYDALIAKGDLGKAEIVKQQLEHGKKTKSLLQKSRISSTDAMYAVEHPKHYTAKQILNNANNAGLEGARDGAVIGAGISIIRNIALMKNGDITGEVVAKNIIADTASGAVGGYFVAASSAALKGAMQNASSSAIQNLSKTQFPNGAVGLAYGITKAGITNFVKYKTGEISKQTMIRTLSKDTVKSSLVTCSLAMIAFPQGVVGAIATMGVAIYLDAVCTNLLNEVFGDGFYAEVLHATGYIYTASLTLSHSLKRISENNYKVIQNLTETKINQEQAEADIDALMTELGG